MTAPMRPMVQAQQVCKDFGALSVLKGVTLSVDRAVGVGQVDIPAVYQPSRDRLGRPALRRR